MPTNLGPAGYGSSFGSIDEAQRDPTFGMFDGASPNGQQQQQQVAPQHTVLETLNSDLARDVNQLTSVNPGSLSATISATSKVNSGMVQDNLKQANNLGAQAKDLKSQVKDTVMTAQSMVREAAAQSGVGFDDKGDMVPLPAMQMDTFGKAGPNPLDMMGGKQAMRGMSPGEVKAKVAEIQRTINATRNDPAAPSVSTNVFSDKPAGPKQQGANKSNVDINAYLEDNKDFKNLMAIDPHNLEESMPEMAKLDTFEKELDDVSAHLKNQYDNRGAKASVAELEHQENIGNTQMQEKIAKNLDLDLDGRSHGVSMEVSGIKDNNVVAINTPLPSAVANAPAAPTQNFEMNPAYKATLSSGMAA